MRELRRLLVPGVLLATAALVVVSGCGDPRGKSGDAVAAGQEPTCTSCHGGVDNDTGAPPRGLRGSATDGTAALGVGAHTAHVTAGLFSVAFTCTDCHPDPRFGSTSHHDGRLQMAFGSRATAGGSVTPVFDVKTRACSNTYCHGGFPGGNVDNTPRWNTVDGTQAACGTCHGVPPPSPHPQSTSCGSCHAGYSSDTVNVTTHVNGVVDVAGLSCTSCHGDAARLPEPFEPLVAAAPPAGTRGEQAPSSRAVGAHQLHLGSGSLATGFTCRDCHRVPSSLAHSDGNVDMVWGALATTGGAGPQWNGATCSNTYCHGNFRGGNASYAPEWTRPATTACGTCHGTPPAAPHPQSSSCGSCHPGYGATSVNPSTHVNGLVEVAGLTCSSCHGDPARAPTVLNPQLPAAPPAGTKGESSTTERAVGAHQLHLVRGAVSTGVACRECHAVPASPAHANGQVDMAWGSLATNRGAAPRWDGVRCSNTYCHGSFRGGSTTYAPEWTRPAATTCGTCHGVPPPAPHPQSPVCGGCHGGYTATSVDPTRHLNGFIDLDQLTCTSCHGDPARAPTPQNPQLAAAPPYGTHGETQVSDRSVGAHQLHLGAGALGGAVACTECHALPTITQHSNGKVDLAWGPISTTQDATPAWDATSNRCSNTYCHGRFNGGNSYAPDWIHPVAASQVCGTCHGVPPPAPHPSNTQCGGCHAGYGATTVNTALHVNGTVELTLTCTSCHGDPARPPTAANPQIAVAPPIGTEGETATSDRAVGAHQQHLGAGPLSNGIACRECHQIPTSMQHPNGTVDLTWGALAKQGNVSPVWDGSTCSNTYCHGAFAGGSAYAPQWTRPAASACGSCHGLPPPTPHPPSSRCGGCHEGYSDTVANPAKHVNGTIDVAGLTCASCHGDATRVATSKNPQLPAAPPYGTRGEALTSERAVGAHQRHLEAGPAGAAMACTECHLVPTSMAHATGTVELSWGPLATTGALQPAWNGITCSNTYCHGGFRNGNATYAPQWTTPVADACGTCHGLPPGGTHPKSVNCGGCHGGYGTRTVNVTDHLDGRVELLPMTCTSCHGDDQRVAVAGADLNVKLAPPSTATGRPPGAHDAHDNRSAVTSPPVGCASCHQGAFDFSTALGPGAIGNHPTGTLVVSFAGRAAGPSADAGGVVWSRSLPAPSYDSTAWTCSSTYCHGNYAGTFTYSMWDWGLDASVTRTASFSGGAGAPTWTGGPTTCESCHGNPPANGVWHSTSHPYRDCHDCHPGADGLNGVGTAITLPSRHIDGVLDVEPQWRTACFGCH